MHDRHSPRPWSLIALMVCAVALCFAPASATPAHRSTSAPAAKATDLQAAFAAAAKEFGVPEHILLAVSYNLSRWENHGGAPSFAGGYGPMHLTHLDSVPSVDGKGDGVVRTPRDTRTVVSLHTLDAAATLLGLSPDVLRRDPVQNIRGGAALLAKYARTANGALPTSEADWYSAVMRYSQASDLRTAASFADLVYATIQRGAARTTDDGQTVILAAAAIVPNKPAALAAISTAATPAVECPSDPSVTCEFIPAAYKQNDPNDPTNYGNYDLANRPADRLDVRYIVIHDAEGSYAGTLQVFQDPMYGSSAHYVVRSLDGHIAQMVETKNVAWHAGNWYINGHAIGIEHEGYAIQGATWYTEKMYQASAALVRYLALKYNIPFDRAHIIGHDDIPGPTSSYQAGMHWDPGPYWDWAHYMDLIQAPIGAPDTGLAGKMVTLRVDPKNNTQTVKDCEGHGAKLKRGTNFVYLRTKPSASAPYITDPYISSDPLCANNWANKAVSGQMFYRFAISGDWDGIYFGGKQAWFYNPGHKTYTVAGTGTLVKPKGNIAISAYGRAYPEASAYPSGVPVQPVSVLSNYIIPAGQLYVAFGPFKSDYYYAPTYTPTLEGSANQDIQGQTEYYQIFYNHRFVFVQAADVAVVPSP
jgi:N-acetyl-anhydromuramyl-L-alanine amidase AmpD